MKKKLLVILGPTATGKTDLALKIAKQYQGELIACDSRQVYLGLDIGSGKAPTGEEAGKVKKHSGFWEIDGIKIWMYDRVTPKKRFTVKDYVDQASKIVTNIVNEGKLPIIVGGTGLYLKALLEGMPNLEIPFNPTLREELEKLSLPQLQARLQNLSPQKWINLNESDRQNKRRLLRSIELTYMYPYKNTKSKWLGLESQLDVLKIGLTAPRQVLNQRIDQRLSARIKQGLIKEGEKLQREGMSLQRMRELGLEYGILADLLEGKINQGEFYQILANKIHQYAKRQMTWFKKTPSVVWFDITNPNFLEEVEKTIHFWYTSSDVKEN